MSRRVFKGEGKSFTLETGYMSKADVARALFKEGFTVTQVSKLVPMAYSQAHSISQKIKGDKGLPDGNAKAAVARAQSSWGQSDKAPAKKSMKPIKSPILDAIKKGKPVVMPKPRPGIGKLRIPGLPSDTDVGECVNCGFGLVIRPDHKSGQMLLIHVGSSQEDYFSTIQFCHGVPKALIA